MRHVDTYTSCRTRAVAVAVRAWTKHKSLNVKLFDCRAEKCASKFSRTTIGTVGKSRRSAPSCLYLCTPNHVSQSLFKGKHHKPQQHTADIRRTEVVPPLAHAMRLVDNKSGHELPGESTKSSVTIWWFICCSLDTENCPTHLPLSRSSILCKRVLWSSVSGVV